MECTIYETVDIVGKRWSLLIILELYKSKNATRYSTLRTKVDGISPKMLAQRLRELEKHGLIRRKMDRRQIPVGCYYSLTRSGLDLVRIIKSLKKWSLKWKITNKSCEQTNCRHCSV